MDNSAAKLDQLAEKLLDIGKRNNMIRFRDTKASTVEVLVPEAEELFEKVKTANTFEVFEPHHSMEDEESKEEKTVADKEEYVNQYAAKMKKQNQLLLYHPAADPLTALSGIDKKAREYIEETGVNVAYMAFGFIHWKEREDTEHVYRAPVLLVPVQLERKSILDPYVIRSTDEDVVVNPTFSYKMNAEYGMTLPVYQDEGLEDYLRVVAGLVNKVGWKVTADCRIGIFSFLKINMYHDLKDNKEEILANPIVRQILGEPVDPAILPSVNEISNLVKDPLIDLHSVVDADSSQIEAIEMAKSGQSFVLQGPPGTGKSQTITNIIAECLSDGKKVLFVSEKLAALNVVYEKLKQEGLAEFCLQLHSHKANKRDVINDINHTLHLKKSSVSSKAYQEIESKQKAEHQLNRYAKELHEKRQGIEKSLYELYELYAQVESMPDVRYVIPQISSKGNAYYKDTVDLMKQYVTYIGSVGYDYRKNPWYGYINQDLSYETQNEVKQNFTSLQKLLENLIPFQKEISDTYAIQCECIEDARYWNAFFAFASDSSLITPSLLNKDHFEMAETIMPDLQKQSEEILSLRASLMEKYSDEIFKLDGNQYHQRLVVEFGGFFSRLFNADYKKLIVNLQLRKKDGSKLSYNEALQITEQLSEYQKKCEKYAQDETSVKSFLGTAYTGIESEWNVISEQMSQLKALQSGHHTFGKLGMYESFTSRKEEFADIHRRYVNVFSSCPTEVIDRVSGYFDEEILNIRSLSGEQLLNRVKLCRDEMNKLVNWCHFRDVLSSLKERDVLPVVDEMLDENIETGKIVGTFQKLFISQWIHKILSESEVLSGFTRVSQDQAIQLFKEKDQEQFNINKAIIREHLSFMRPDLSMAAAGSALSILLREGEKKRKQKSIRQLFTETGELVQMIKPCFLMSPLSVSTYLAPDSVHFDVVIFDEASQIFPEDAIGAIYRGSQLIVVGDSKQMPPTNFFNAMTDVDNKDDETEDVTDFESILDFCSASMKQLRLCWHYRSRYEELITFSNQNFYDNSLITFPSSKAGGKWTGVDYHHVDSIYDRKSRTNRKEAEYIVDLIYQNIEKYPDRSLGVVAFSVAQQNLIDKLLSRRRQRTPEKESFFRNDKTEPFFIKNLETVQGDERDTIIFSVAYGTDEQGRLLLNFGPLNKEGGERRLNVAITRAKCNVQFVTSMHYYDIDLSRTSSKGVTLLQEYLDYAENGRIALQRNVTVSEEDQFDSDFELEVCEFLRSHSYAVDTQVGCSGYKIDLGLKRTDSSDYVLAIECDGATYHSSKNARDRDRLRQSVLERMGWKFYRIWSTEWFNNKSVEQQRLLEVVDEALKNVSEIQKPEQSVPVEMYEEKDDTHFEFPLYKVADVEHLANLYFHSDFKKMVKEILKVEAPLSEEWLLKRIVKWYGQDKVIKRVKDRFEWQMDGCWLNGIMRIDNFLYLMDEPIHFRAPGDVKREIKYIAKEELAEGMYAILKQNVSADKSGLYHSLARQCGVTRVGKAIYEVMDAALALLEKENRVVVDGETVTIRQK